MAKLDARTEEYEHVELFGKPALFTESRISRFTVPQGWFCYDLRGSDNDPGDPVTVEKFVGVNHAGTILTPAEIPFKKGKDYMPIKDGLNFLGDKMTLEEFCAEQRLEYPADTRKYAPRPASQSEAGLFYALKPELNELLGGIGHLRMDFGRHGTEFWTRWFDHCGDKWNTLEFKAEIDEVINELRQTVLRDRASMRSYCADFGGELGKDYGEGQYGYVVETEHYRYCLRCKPQEGDYDGYLWCFDKRVQEMNQEQEEKACEVQPIVGRLTFANGDVLEFTDPAEYIAKLREEIDFINTTGMKYETLTDDPRTRKAVDDIVYDFFGEENPRPLEDYKASQPAMQMGGMGQ